MVLGDIVTRFEYYARRLKSVSHVPGDPGQCAFAHTEIEDLLGKLTSGLKFPAILVLTPEVEKDGDFDSLAEAFDVMFVVVVADYDKDRRTLLDEAKAIADNVLRMIMVDVAAEETFIGMLQGTSEGEYGPVDGGRMYGWGVSLSFIDGFDGELDPEDLNDLADDDDGEDEP